MTQHVIDGDEVAAEVDQVRERIVLLMWRNKVSQTALARQLGVEPQTVGKKLRGERGISLDDLIAIGRALGVDPAELLAAGDRYTPSDSNREPADYDDSAADLRRNVVDLATWRERTAS